MTCASLVAALLLGQVSAVDPSDLIAQLGSSRYAERQAATAALAQLGRRALPALKSAGERKDPETRTRAVALMARIEGALLTEASQVTLDFQDAPLVDVLRSFSGQAGVRLTVLPENSLDLLTRKVTLHERGPLPFWKAIDRLCEAAHLQYNFGMNTYPMGREASFPPFEGGIRLVAPVSDSGPFRISVLGAHYQSDVTFPPAPQFRRNGPGANPAGLATARREESFFVQMQVAGEPRLSLIQNAPLRVLDAVDDRGNALAVPPSGDSDLRGSGYLGIGVGSSIQVQAPMTRPGNPGATIKHLKGVIPLLVSTWKPSPLVVPLAGAAGRTFQNDDVAITVHEVRGQPTNHPHAIEVTIRPSTVSGSGLSAAGFDGNEARFARADTYLQQLEVIDAQGHPIRWSQSSIDSEAGRLTVNLTTPERPATATELHYYSLIRATAEVPFEFSNIPMP